MTQAPTPGPLSGNDVNRECKACGAFKAERDASCTFCGLAPTAPVEASGSEELWSVGSWLSAALDDPKVCDAMKSDIRDWFDNGGHLRPQPSGFLATLTDEQRGEALAYTGDDTHPQLSGETREHGPKCWGKTSASDEMAHCYCGSTDLRPQPSGETRERAEKLASALNDLIPAVRAYLMTGDVMSQGIKKNTWEPVLKRAQAALTFDPPTTDATTASALSATIRTSLLGVAPDDQDVTLEDSDWRLILGALEGRK